MASYIQCLFGTCYCILTFLTQNVFLHTIADGLLYRMRVRKVHCIIMPFILTFQNVCRAPGP